MRLQCQSFLIISFLSLFGFASCIIDETEEENFYCDLEVVNFKFNEYPSLEAEHIVIEDTSIYVTLPKDASLDSLTTSLEICSSMPTSIDEIATDFTKPVRFSIRDHQKIKFYTIYASTSKKWRLIGAAAAEAAQDTTLARMTKEALGRGILGAKVNLQGDTVNVVVSDSCALDSYNFNLEYKFLNGVVDSTIYIDEVNFTDSLQQVVHAIIQDSTYNIVTNVTYADWNVKKATLLSTRNVALSNLDSVLIGMSDTIGMSAVEIELLLSNGFNDTTVTTGPLNLRTFRTQKDTIELPCMDYVIDIKVEDLDPFGFYDEQVLRRELPEIFRDINYIKEPYVSYQNASAKGNDEASTKKADLIKWHKQIRHAKQVEGSIYEHDHYFKRYNGKEKVYADSPTWNFFNIGTYSREYMENLLDYYNLMRALFGGQRVYMSGYKQVAAQASSWCNLLGSHYPTWEGAEAYGYSRTLYNVAYDGRAACNLMGGDWITKDPDFYADMYNFPENANSALARIWGEGEGDKINGLGHRNSFMFAQGKDVGIGRVHGYFSWMSWGASPKNWDGNGLGASEQQAIYNSYPAGETPRGMMMFPSHGYFPYFAISNSNQTVSLKVNSDDVSPIDKVRDKGKTITLKMEYFKHDSDGDLATMLTTPYKTLELTDVIGSGLTSDDYVLGCYGDDPCDGVIEKGGYHFSTDHGMGIVFRMPHGWFNEIKEDFNQNEASHKPQYHTIRYSFEIEGEALKVKQPFYMNPTVGENLVVQTTFFDIFRHDE